MMISNYLVTVVVATHNRSGYAIPCIKSILDISSEFIQVAVHDTSNDDCELKEWAAVQTDHRFKYVHWAERLSMTENHERALALAEGEYVCLIGDDDSVSEKILDVAEYAKRKFMKLVTPKVKASYYWPDFRSRFYGGAHAGRIYIQDFNGRIEERDVHEGLNKTLLMACQGTDYLPKLYHGLVSKEILDNVREKNGKIFFGTSPDISSAIALSLSGGSYYVINYPFILPGSAGGSNSGRSASRKHKGDLATDPHIEPFKNLVWPNVIPKFFSVETVWSQAAWETLVSTNSVSWLDKTNLARLYALCLFRHSSYFPSVFHAWKSSRINGIRNIGTACILKEIVIVIFESFIAKFKRLMHPGSSNGQKIIATVDDVYCARKELDDYLSLNRSGSAIVAMIDVNEK